MDINQPKINIKDSETIKCESCGGIYFREVIYLKKVSRFQLADASQDVPVPFPIYKCDSCGHINKGFNPFEDVENDSKVISE
jgi:uncharacterized Zn finger protein